MEGGGVSRRKNLLRYIASLPQELEEIDLAGYAILPAHLARAWRSRRFVVQLYEEPNGTRLSVQRSTDSDPVRVVGRERPLNWDELMDAKREAGFGDRWAVEIYPPDAQVVNVCPMRHLWLLSAPPDYGWRGPEAIHPEPSTQDREEP